MKKDVLFVIFGATGDLAKKKLLPAIYNILVNESADNFAVVGIAREDINGEKLVENSKKFIKNANKKVMEKLKKRCYYFRADFYDEERFVALGDFIREKEKKHRLEGNRLFYLATMPQHFGAIANALSRCKLVNKKKNTWSRVVFEKPFGHDLKSAKKINNQLKKIFREEQIYRIDHYLGKELVQNISIIRFTNTILEPLWNRNYIDHVQIILSEDFGLEGRGNYYDEHGAMRDVVQNHMLQLLCLTSMESPVTLTAQHIRNEKVKVLKSAKKIDSKNVVLGQYEGYKKEKGVKKNSKTETFAALKLFVNNSRWKEVPFYFITGKGMKDKITSIYIQFKQAPCLLFRGICNFEPNYLVIQIQPEEGFYMRLNAKVPASSDITSVMMDFCHECTFGPNTPEAYETLLMDVVKGDQSVFVRSDEIEEQWKIVDNIIGKRLRIHPHKKGSYPEKAKEFIEKDNRQWHLRAK